MSSSLAPSTGTVSGRAALSDTYLKDLQARVMAVPPGPWPVEPNDHGVPDAVGPISFIETWDRQHQLPVVEFIGHAREALPRLLGEIARLKDRVKLLEAGPAFPWAARMDADDLEEFLADLALTASGDDDLTTLQAVEKVIRTWHVIAIAQHAHNTAPGPNGGA